MITIYKDLCDSREQNRYQAKANLEEGFHLILSRNGHSGEAQHSKSTTTFESDREPYPDIVIRIFTLGMTFSTWPLSTGKFYQNQKGRGGLIKVITDLGHYFKLLFSSINYVNSADDTNSKVTTEAIGQEKKSWPKFKDFKDVRRTLRMRTKWKQLPRHIIRILPN